MQPYNRSRRHYSSGECCLHHTSAPDTDKLAPSCLSYPTIPKPSRMNTEILSKVSASRGQVPCWMQKTTNAVNKKIKPHTRRTMNIRTPQNTPVCLPWPPPTLPSRKTLQTNCHLLVYLADVCTHVPNTTSCSAAPYPLYLPEKHIRNKKNPVVS